MKTKKQETMENKTNITVEMVYVTPEVAKNYLRFNNANRTVSALNLTFLSNQMKKGLFIENGESIVFDINGELKDGQHRLEAIVRSGKSYFIPIVRGVVSSSMATFDTGKTRSAADILKLNGFKYSTSMAAAIQGIFKYGYRKSKNAHSNSLQRAVSLSNQEVLNYCSENYDILFPMIRDIHTIYPSQNPKVISTSQMFIFLYMICDFEPKEEHYMFLKLLCGINKQEGTSTNYLYTKLYNSKINKEPLNFYWILGMVIKAWNYYSDGNPSVKYFKFDVSSDLPIPNLSTI